MLSIDTNLLLYAAIPGSPLHRPARRFLDSLAEQDDVVLSEFVLAELYQLLRNPAVFRPALEAGDAVTVVNTYREHPRWAVVGLPPRGREFHDALWKAAATPGLARRRFFDIRIALSLQAFGVTRFATVNTTDFIGLGFAEVWDPTGPASGHERTSK